MTIPILPGLAAVAPAYDGFILDLWGLIHDGSAAYPGAIETLGHLRDLGKRVVLLSNAPRRARSLELLLSRMGIAPDLYNAVMSSGEAVHDALLHRRDPWFQALGRHCLHVGPERDRALVEGLNLIRVDSPGEASFLLNTGPDDVEDTLADYRPLLDLALAGKLPMICANPDLVVMHEGREMICAGSLAAYYAAEGGDVRYRGKPDPAIYATCFTLLGIDARERILAVGDAFHTDMAGAARCGIDGLLCTGGIHAAELGTLYGRPPTPDKLAALAARFSEITPIAAIAGFTW